MSEKNEIRSVEMVRRIRDEMATVLEGRSHAEIIAYFKKAGDVSREEAKRRRKIEFQTELHG
jgi:hypothetical protein